MNAANPVVIGDKVLLTECYGPGAAFLDLKGGKPKEIWTDAEKDRFDRSLACHWNTPIHVDGFVYGCSGRNANDAEMRCVELATGDVKWAQAEDTAVHATCSSTGTSISLGEDGTAVAHQGRTRRSTTRCRGTRCRNWRTRAGRRRC